MFSCNYQSHLGVMDDNDTRSLFLMSSLSCNLFLVAVTTENLLHKDKVLEMEQAFQCFCGNFRIFCLDFIQNESRFEVVSDILYSHCRLQSQVVDPLLAQTKLIHLAYSQMGHGSILPQFRGLLWLGSNAQTDLKAEIGDYE